MARSWRSWRVALVDPTETWDPVVHDRRDLPVRGVRISEREEDGQAVVSLTLGRQTDALRGPQAKQWAFLSRVLADGSLRLMAWGHLVGTPLRGSGEDGLPVVELRCSPVDWDTPQAQAVAACELLPFYDPVLVSPTRRADAREVLDGWYRTVHCDRATHAFSTPDKLGIGLPNLPIAAPCVDPLPRAEQREAPVSYVDIVLSCEFLQTGSGTLDVSSKVKGAFPYGYIDTLTPEALEKSWFRVGADIGGDSGWTIAQSVLARIDPAAFPSPLPLSTPLKAGPFAGAPEKQTYAKYYSWVNDQSQTTPYIKTTVDGRKIKRFDYSGTVSGDPGGLHGALSTYDRVYYDCRLVAGWTVRQKRVESVTLRLVNGCQQLAPGPSRRIELRCEDVTEDDSTTWWTPATAYKAGTTVRVGMGYVQCQFDHQSAATWAADQTQALPNGTVNVLWTVVPGLLSPRQDRTLASYLQTPRGLQTVQAAMLKGRRILADSSRCVDVTVRAVLDDDSLLAVSTAMTATVTCQSDLLDGGTATGKVTSYEIVSDQDDDHVDVTIRCCIGSGASSSAAPVAYDAYGNVVPSVPVVDVLSVNVAGQPWDLIAVGNVLQQPAVPFPPVTAAAGMANGADGQSNFVHANDFVWNDDARNDDNQNEPDTLLTKVPTRILIQFAQISGRPTMYNAILPVMMTTWGGPRQYDTEAA